MYNYNNPVLITGCQRSGTTLLSLILDSHPQIRSVDETEFDGGKLSGYLEHSDYHPHVAFKLPGDAAFFRSFRALPGVKVLWCVRDPRDVVLSMINLKMEIFNSQAIAWANHNLGAMREIENCLPFVGSQRPLSGIAEFQRVSAIPYHLRDRRDAVSMGALCWELKNGLLDWYTREAITFMVVVYEDLVSKPKPTLEKVLSFLEVPWHDNVLRHHELHNEIYVGNTLGSRPIDPLNTGKWKVGLSNEELAIIGSICATGAGKFGYQLTGSSGHEAHGQVNRSYVFG